jgi:hypothetical protein
MREKHQVVQLLALVQLLNPKCKCYLKLKIVNGKFLDFQLLNLKIENRIVFQNYFISFLLFFGALWSSISIFSYFFYYQEFYFSILF